MDVIRLHIGYSVVRVVVRQEDPMYCLADVIGLERKIRDDSTVFVKKACSYGSDASVYFEKFGPMWFSSFDGLLSYAAYWDRRAVDYDGQSGNWSRYNADEARERARAVFLVAHRLQFAWQFQASKASDESRHCSFGWRGSVVSGCDMSDFCPNLDRRLPDLVRILGINSSIPKFDQLAMVLWACLFAGDRMAQDPFRLFRTHSLNGDFDSSEGLYPLPRDKMLAEMHEAMADSIFWRQMPNLSVSEVVRNVCEDRSICKTVSFEADVPILDMDFDSNA